MPSRRWAERRRGRAQAPPGHQRVSAVGPEVLWLGPHTCLETVTISEVTARHPIWRELEITAFPQLLPRLKQLWAR